MWRKSGYPSLLRDPGVGNLARAPAGHLHCPTGYQDNWRRFAGSEYRQGAVQKIYRKKGEYPNHVLLSFDDLEGVFMDFMSWHIAMNACTNGRPVPVRETTMILKPSWTRSRWIRAARHPHAVDRLVPDLPLGSASGVWVRNRTVQRKMGFWNVEVVRVPVDSGS